MNMVAIPKQAYDEILKRQARTDITVAKLQKAFERFAQDEELLPEVTVRLERQSKLMDEGNGRHFKDMKELRAYVRSL